MEDEVVGSNVAIEQVTFSEKEIVRQLLEFNSYEFSRFVDADLDVHGRFGYRWLDHYWTEPGRHPFTIRVGGRIAGLALVREGAPHQIAEFLVMPKYRRAGVGTDAARLIFRRFPGRWEVHQVPGNDAATAFWRRAIPVGFSERTDETGTTQAFTTDVP